MGLFTDGFKLLKKASEPLYKTPKSIQETIEIMAVAENGIFEVSKNKYSKCTHRNYPMIELKQYIDNIVLNSNMFFSVAVPIMREINTNIRRLSAHTTIMTYEKLVNTRQRIMESGLLHFLPYQREHIVFRWCLRQRLRYVQLPDFCRRIRGSLI